MCSTRTGRCQCEDLHSRQQKKQKITNKKEEQIPGEGVAEDDEEPARSIADILNPYAKVSQQHKKTFIRLQNRRKSQYKVQPKSCFEACMALPATDVGIESTTFTMPHRLSRGRSGEKRWHSRSFFSRAMCKYEKQRVTFVNTATDIKQGKHVGVSKAGSACQLDMDDMSKVPYYIAARPGSSPAGFVLKNKNGQPSFAELDHSFPIEGLE